MMIYSEKKSSVELIFVFSPPPPHHLNYNPDHPILSLVFCPVEKNTIFSVKPKLYKNCSQVCWMMTEEY